MKPKCRAQVILYIDGKPEYEWRCELEADHTDHAATAHHLDGRYQWDAW